MRRLIPSLGLCFALAASIPVAFAQTQQPAPKPEPCKDSEYRQFDFWLGEWDLTWSGGGKGTNVIRATLDNCVIEERFDGTPAIALRGGSVSTFNKSTGKWHQTWVDNQGGYLDFVGEFKDGQMILQRKAVLQGKDILQRMVWYNIGKDQLDWNWERSDDNGKTWQLLWKLNYKRKK